MKNDLSIKLVAVINSVKLILYKAQGIKIIEEIANFPIVSEKHHHHNQEKTESHYQKKSTPGSLFEPHSTPKDLEYYEAAKKASEILEKKINGDSEYNQLIIVAEPKILGYVRQSISNNLKKIIYKEIVKNLVGRNVKIIEQTIFS
jgi:protein required for attachment to host cells